MLVEPLLERPRHILQGLALVSHFAAAGSTPVEEHGEERQPESPLSFFIRVWAAFGGFHLEAATD